MQSSHAGKLCGYNSVSLDLLLSTRLASKYGNDRLQGENKGGVTYTLSTHAHGLALLATRSLHDYAIDIVRENTQTILDLFIHEYRKLHKFFLVKHAIGTTIQSVQVKHAIGTTIQSVHTPTLYLA